MKKSFFIFLITHLFIPIGQVRADSVADDHAQRFQKKLETYAEERINRRGNYVQTFDLKDINFDLIPHWPELFFEQLKKNHEHSYSVEASPKQQREGQYKINTIVGPDANYIPELTLIVPLEKWMKVFRDQKQALLDCPSLTNCQLKNRVFYATLDKFAKLLKDQKKLNTPIYTEFINFLHEQYQNMNLGQNPDEDSPSLAPRRFLYIALSLGDPRAFEKLKDLVKNEEQRLANTSEDGIVSKIWSSIQGAFPGTEESNRNTNYKRLKEEEQFYDQKPHASPR